MGDRDTTSELNGRIEGKVNQKILKVIGIVATGVVVPLLFILVRSVWAGNTNEHETIKSSIADVQSGSNTKIAEVKKDVRLNGSKADENKNEIEAIKARAQERHSAVISILEQMRVDQRQFRSDIKDEIREIKSP